MRGEAGEAGQEAAQHVGKDAHKEDDLQSDWEEGKMVVKWRGGQVVN